MDKHIEIESFYVVREDVSETVTKWCKTKYYQVFEKEVDIETGEVFISLEMLDATGYTESSNGILGIIVKESVFHKYFTKITDEEEIMALRLMFGENETEGCDNVEDEIEVPVLDKNSTLLH